MKVQARLIHPERRSRKHFQPDIMSKNRTA